MPRAQKGWARGTDNRYRRDKGAVVQDLVRETIEEHISVARAMQALEPVIAKAGQMCADALRSGKRIYLCGNGGSAADAQHIAAELIGRFVSDRPPLVMTTGTSRYSAGRLKGLQRKVTSSLPFQPPGIRQIFSRLCRWRESAVVALLACLASRGDTFIRPSICLSLFPRTSQREFRRCTL